MKFSKTLACFCVFSTLFAEDRSANPLYKALPPLDATLEGLMAMEPKGEGFLPVPFRESLAANWVPTEENFFQDKGVQLAEERFDAFCQAEPTEAQIPHLIHLIWLGSAPPHNVQLAVSSWEKHHPAWEVKLWTEKDLVHFPWSSPRTEAYFKNGKNWAEKSDILRFEILYQYGGIYSDTDVVCLKPFDELLNTGSAFIACFESNKIKRLGRPLIGSAIVAAAKGSSVIKSCIDHSQSAEEAPHIHQHIRSGPGPISLASYEALEAGRSDVLLLPCSYFYPLPWEKRLATLPEVIANIRPESFAIHLWEGSWFDSYHPPKSN